MVLTTRKPWMTLAAVLALSLSLMSYRAGGQEPCIPHKKASKAVLSLFGDPHEIRPLGISADSALQPESYHPGDCIYLITSGDQVTGYLLSTRAKGRFDYFDYSIVFSDDFRVMKVLVTVYRSTHGAAISQKKWLSQFEGYHGGELRLGSDIDAVTGGTLSATSIIKDIRRCQQLISTLGPVDDP